MPTCGEEEVVQDLRRLPDQDAAHPLGRPVGTCKNPGDLTDNQAVTVDKITREVATCGGPTRG
jgi:hypothetical protein